MNSAKQNILARLNRTPLSAKHAFARPAQSPAEPSTEFMTEQFVQALESNHAEVIITARSALTQILSALFIEKKISTLLTSERTRHMLPTADAPQYSEFPESIEIFKQALFNKIDAAITTSQGAIAETGSIILWPDSVEPRSMSLVPPVHLVLVEQKSLFPDFQSAIQRQAWSQAMPTNAILVSGPSKTADIQQTLAYGAHGPHELIVLLLTG